MISSITYDNSTSTTFSIRVSHLQTFASGYHDAAYLIYVIVTWTQMLRLQEIRAFHIEVIH